MRSKTLRMPDSTWRDVARAAREDRTTAAEWIREAVRLRLLADSLPRRVEQLERRVDHLEHEAGRRGASARGHG